MKQIVNRMWIVLMILSLPLMGQVQITNTDIYETVEQMLLANEINESGEPFAEALGYNLDDLDPMVLNSPDSISYVMGIESYEYSRYQLGTIVSRSGMGLHMMWAPIISQMAAMEMDSSFDGMYTGGMTNGFKEDDELMKTIMHFSMLTNHMPPGNPWPQFAEFVSGNPHLPQVVDPAHYSWDDFSSLRWNRTLMDKTLNPAAMGQTLMKQYLWAQDMLSAFHDSLDNGIDPDGVITPDSTGSIHFDPAKNVYYGGDGLDGFIGMVLTAEGINKVKFIVSSLAYDGTSLGMIDLPNYDPANGIQYFPHKISVTESTVHPMLPPKADSFTVTDWGSELFDQTSLLWGTLNFKNMMDPTNTSNGAHLAYHSVFDGDPFPADMTTTGMPGPFDLMKGTSKVIFQNLVAMHFNSDQGTFVDRSELSTGQPVLGNEVQTVNVSYALVALNLFIQEFAGTPLETMALDALNAQASFLLNSLQDSNGGFYNGYVIGAGADTGAKLAESQAAASRGLYAAFLATNNTAYLDGANNGYTYLRDQFYDSASQSFRTEEGNNVATYTPFNFAVITGGLREASLVGDQSDAPILYTRFFKSVANRMQLREGPNTGETGSDSDGDGIPFIPDPVDALPPVFASEATLILVTVSTDDQGLAGLPGKFSLSQNFPNPFNPVTTIHFQIEEPGQYALNVYNLLGEHVQTLLDDPLFSREYSIKFNAGNLPSGIYYYELSGSGFKQVKKLVLLK